LVKANDWRRIGRHPTGAESGTLAQSWAFGLGGEHISLG
jgi:hypothetical protein